MKEKYERDKQLYLRAGKLYKAQLCDVEWPGESFSSYHACLVPDTPSMLFLSLYSCKIAQTPLKHVLPVPVDQTTTIKMFFSDYGNNTSGKDYSLSTT